MRIENKREWLCLLSEEYDEAQDDAQADDGEGQACLKDTWNGAWANEQRTSCKAKVSVCRLQLARCIKQTA